MAAVLVVRHAQSVWNADGRWQGHADPPLSEGGEAQAMAARSRIAEEGFELVVTSDLLRARRTAELLTTGTVPAVSEPLLRELDVGEWTGLTRTEIEARWPSSLEQFDGDRMPGAPGGETRTAFDGRVAAAAVRLAEMAADRDATRVLVIAHGGVIRSLARLSDLVERPVPHLCGYRGRTMAEGAVLHTWADFLADDQVGDPMAL